MYQPTRILFVTIALLAATPAQVSWSLESPTTSPPPRNAAVAAYDSARERVVMFGGAVDGAAIASDETWEWNGSTWGESAATDRPAGRWAHTMAYDSARERVVLFGGWDGAGDLGDTWEYDGVNWTLVATTGPAPRRAQSMTYDSVRERVVLFGGARGPGNAPVPLNDTWEWDGTTWVMANPTSAPAPRWGSTLVFDPPSGKTILFGGFDPWTTHGETWEWDGAAWRLISPPYAPANRGACGAAFDSRRGRIVMFSGYSWGNTTAETWEWNGATWENRSPLTWPAPRGDAAFAYDAARDECVVFGGWGPGRLGDTWTYRQRQPASVERFGQGCAGSVGVPQLDLDDGRLPWIGGAFGARLTSLPASPFSSPIIWAGVSRVRYDSLSLPFSLAPFGAPGCSMLVGPFVSTSLANLGGTALYSMMVPNEPDLIGRALFFQGIVPDPGANAIGVIVSNGLEARIGAR